MKKQIALLLLLGLLISAAWHVAADPNSLTLRWRTVDGGGVSSVTGGNYTLSATAGQPDVNTLNGGDYTLRGGFWDGPPTYSLYLPIITNE